MSPPSVTQLREQFFEYTFGEAKGYLCVASSDPPNKRDTFRQSFFEWPKGKAEAVTFIDVISSQRKNLWYCVNLLDAPKRLKENCLPTNLIWADLDTTHPSKVTPYPSLVTESSPGRFQAIWRLDDTLAPETAEAISKKIAYAYASAGADKGGWDLTQLLRIPFTYNYKYDSVPEISIMQASDTLVPVSAFISLPNVDPSVSTPDENGAMPDVTKLPDPKMVIYKYWPHLSGTAFSGIYDADLTDHDDWSKILWRLINICFEAGMSEEEVLTIAASSKCNKYARDNRPMSALWREVLKAASAHATIAPIKAEAEKLIVLPSISAFENPPTKTFVEDFVEFGQQSTDAIPSFLELGGFILLSGILAANLELKTSYGPMTPNLWGMILGESTLTRKTTAMSIVLRLLQEVDDNIVLATDGSAEGLLTRLADRPNRVSLFYKDEISGFFDSMNRKDYLAGMQETLTQLYDVPEIYSRTLRKETITIRSPILVFFGGGIRDKVYELVDDNYIYSGFLPRFLIVSGETDKARLRRTGPPTVENTESRNQILKKLTDLHDTYQRSTVIKIAGQEAEVDIKTEAVLTSEAWNEYGDIEEKMVDAAYYSPMSALALPMFERLSRSTLKMSMLLAASRQKPEDGKITVEPLDIRHAAYYVERWGAHSIHAMYNAGRGRSIRIMDKIRKTIEKNPGIHRSRVMQWHHLTSRDTEDLVKSLVERGEITITKEGRAQRLWPI